MTQIFLFFLGISASVSLIILALISLAPFLNKRYAAKWKRLIWIFLAVRLLVPFGGVNGQFLIKTPQAQNQTVSGQKGNETDHPADQTVPYRRIVVEIPTQMTAPINAQPEKNNAGITALDIMAFVWIIGSLLFLSIHFISYFYYKRQLIKKGRIIEDVSVLCQMTRLKRELRIRRAVQVMEYSEAESPMLTGFLTPILVLPEERYSSEELFFILKHELVHLKRGDVSVKLLLVAANAIHWFNPLIWIMQKEAIVDMELSCDERVTQDTSYAVRKAYTETLLSMLHRRCARKIAFTTQFYGGKKIMKKRFKNILMKNGKKNGSFVFLCTVLFTILFGTLVGCSVKEEDTGKERTENDAIQHASDSSEGKAVPAKQTQDAHSAVADAASEHTTTLTFSKEGEQEQKQATLAVGDGYSIYLPDAEWQQSGPDTWTAAANEQVRLWITRFKGESIDSVDQNLEESGYMTEEGYHKWKQEGDFTYHVSLKASEVDVWGIFYSYPADFAEGFGRELPVIADTFALSTEADDSNRDHPDAASERLLAEDCEEIKTIVDAFSTAYFHGDVDAMQKFLASTYIGKITGYEGAGSISDLTVKGLSDADDKKMENGRYIASLEFRDSDYEDMFLYLTFELMKQKNSWKIQSYGLEG